MSKNAKGMFWPALIGLGGIPKTKESDYYENGKFRMAKSTDKMSFFFRHPVFQGNTNLFYNIEKKYLTLFSRMTYQSFCEIPKREKEVPLMLKAFNYTLKEADAGKVSIISNIYDSKAIKEDKLKGLVKAIFYRGKPDMPVAIVIPGGGFVANVNDCEGMPYAMKLHEAGYNVFIFLHRVGNELHTKDNQKRGEEAVRDMVQFVRFLVNNQKRFGINLTNYAVFGSSAGGLIASAFSFSKYRDSCDKYGLPRPTLIVPIYGLDWSITASDLDKGLAVYSIVGNDDAFGFHKVADKIEDVVRVLGEENASIRVLDNFPHGSGLGYGTNGEGWMEEAIEFWKAHSI